MTTIRRTAVVVRGLLAAAILLVLVVGVPAALLATVGNPIPDRWTWSAPLTNEALLGILACVAWIFWAQLLVCVIVETTAEIRLATGRSADWLARVPGTFGGQQALARTLVQAVVTIGVTTTAASAAATTWVSHADAAVVSMAPVVTPSVSVVSDFASSEPVAKPQRQAAIEVDVVRGDTLWSIAEQHLGAGERWREIADLNRARTMADGATFDDARTIQPGWSLLVPSIASAPVGRHLVTVERGDTLWEIAEEKYGDGAEWPRIYEANEAKIEDPHWIYPGQGLRVPGQGRVAPTTPEKDSPRRPPVTHATRPLVPTPQPSGEPTPSAQRSPDIVVPPPAHERVADPGVDRVDESDEDGFNLDGAAIARALVGGGGFLAAGMLAVYVGRRRTQSRNRRSGKAAPPVAEHLRVEDKALRSIGSAASQRAGFFDAALRELAGMAGKASFDLPEAVAARIDSARLDLHLRTPSTAAPAPWSTSADALVWSLSGEHQPAPTQRMAPYPAMVTVGVDEDGGTWLVDLEGTGVVQIVGETSAGEDLARFIAAELALNPWSHVETVDVAGVAEDVVPLNHGRLYGDSTLDIEKLAKTARQMAENIEASGRSVLASRATDWKNSWVPTICLASLREAELKAAGNHTAALLDEMERTPGRTSVAFIAVSPGFLDHRATALEITADGDLRTPWIVVHPNRLSSDEATVLTKLFDDADTEGDVDIPLAFGADGEPTDVDQAGALAEKLVDTRRGTGDPDSILPRPDDVYVEAAATTVEDLAVLAPAVPPSEAVAAVAADPSLDQDLADWGDPDSPRPKLRVLGPVELHAVGEQTKEVESRPAYFTELAAYLACHPEGLTPNQVAADFGIQNNTLHTRLGQLRKWLGKQPDGDEWHLPPAQRVRGQQVYQLWGVLTDADLFRRLRARGEARGAEGIEDFQEALKLVTGRPYDQQRARGYGWLADTPFDHYLTAAIVDVAHIVATHSIANGQPRTALWAAERAISAAPSEDKPRLDLARVKQAMGRGDGAQDHLHRDVYSRSDDDRAPVDPSDRTVEVANRIHEHDAS